MNLKLAQQHAARLVEQMAPFCERIEIAGSVRRCKQEVKDIEIVAIPKWETRQFPRVITGTVSLFDPLPPAYEWRNMNTLHEWALSSDCPVMWIKTGVPGIIYWKPNQFGRQWKGLLPDGQTKLDLFLCTPQNWGAIYLIRTGSRDFSEAVVTYAKYNTEYRFAGGSLCHTDARGEDDKESLIDISTPEETDVFEKLGLRYVEPKDRHGRAQVVRL